MSTRLTRSNSSRLRRSTRFVRRAQSRINSGNLLLQSRRLFGSKKVRVHKWKEEWVDVGHMQLRKNVKQADVVAVPAPRPANFKKRKRRKHHDVTSIRGVSDSTRELPSALVRFLQKQQELDEEGPSKKPKTKEKPAKATGKGDSSVNKQNSSSKGAKETTTASSSSTEPESVTKPVDDVSNKLQ